MEEVVGSIPTRSTKFCPLNVVSAGVRPSANIKVIPAAPEQSPVLANLLELYAHDFSEFLGMDLGADGKFGGFPDLSSYWREPDRHPFLVKVDDNLAGLVLVKRSVEVSGREAVWDMAEFFIVRAYRRRGIGTQVAHDLWKRFPGAWEVRVMEVNISARQFWERAIPAFTGEVPLCARIEKNGEFWTRFSFQNGSRLVSSH